MEDSHELLSLQQDSTTAKPPVSSTEECNSAASLDKHDILGAHLRLEERATAPPNRLDGNTRSEGDLPKPLIGCLRPRAARRHSEPKRKAVTFSASVILPESWDDSHFDAFPPAPPCRAIRHKPRSRGGSNSAAVKTRGNDDQPMDELAKIIAQHEKAANPRLTVLMTPLAQANLESLNMGALTPRFSDASDSDSSAALEETQPAETSEDSLGHLVLPPIADRVIPRDRDLRVACHWTDLPELSDTDGFDSHSESQTTLTNGDEPPAAKMIAQNNDSGARLPTQLIFPHHNRALPQDHDLRTACHWTDRLSNISDSDWSFSSRDSQLSTPNIVVDPKGRLIMSKITVS